MSFHRLCLDRRFASSRQGFRYSPKDCQSQADIAGGAELTRICLRAVRVSCPEPVLE